MAVRGVCRGFGGRLLGDVAEVVVLCAGSGGFCVLLAVRAGKRSPCVLCRVVFVRVCVCVCVFWMRCEDFVVVDGWVSASLGEDVRWYVHFVRMRGATLGD